MEKFTPDPLPGVTIPIAQPEKGYRFSMDPLILSAHIQIAGAKKIVDIGCGCGIIPLMLATRYPGLNIWGIEIQEELSRLAKQNVVTNQLERSIQIIHDDVQHITPSDIGGKADIIVSNPPYKKENTGRVNPNHQKAVARHEITLDLDLLFNCSSTLSNNRGRLYIIFPAERLSDLILAMTRYRFSLHTIRFVHTKKRLPAKRVIVCAKKNSQQNCSVEPPLYIYSSKNSFTDEYACLMKSF